MFLKEESKFIAGNVERQPRPDWHRFCLFTGIWYVQLDQKSLRQLGLQIKSEGISSER
jgi:hypothetical protein